MPAMAESVLRSTSVTLPRGAYACHERPTATSGPEQIHGDPGKCWSNSDLYRYKIILEISEICAHVKWIRVDFPPAPRSKADGFSYRLSVYRNTCPDTIGKTEESSVL